MALLDLDQSHVIAPPLREFAPAQRAVGIRSIPWIAWRRPMQNTAQIDLDTTVDHVMSTWPATIPIFLQARMACVGCPVRRFHSIEEACWEHGITINSF